MQSDYKIEDKSNWLRLFIRNNNKNRSFLRHLLLLQFLGSTPHELFEKTQFNEINKQIKIHNPILDLEIKRKEWLKIIEDNPNKARCELKKIAKGLHTYIYKYDKEWYEKVTPRVKRKAKKHTINWQSKDEVYLEKVQKAVKDILDKGGKPERICASSIRRECGVTTEILNSKLENTVEFIKNATESIDKYRVRKIKWAIKEMEANGEKVTRYKVQLKCGFGGNCDKKVKELIDCILIC